MIILGAGGHALEVLDLLLHKGHSTDDIIFYDDTGNPSGHVLGRYSIIKSSNEAEKYIQSHDNKFCLGIGNPVARYLLLNRLSSVGGVHCSLQSNHALKSYNIADIIDADIFPFSFIGPNVKLGRGALINTRASVHHDVNIDDYAEISPSATILGGAIIGEFSRIGSGAVILPKIRIGMNVIIGAGSVVTKDLPDNVIAMGVPAKISKKLPALVLQK
jgi:sugar O-acyltransferase (sialic acid O-acetyltransferase NeuD family)